MENDLEARGNAMIGTLDPTLTIHDAADRTWDAVIIGAGVAGATCAYLLGQSGLSVLLVDKSAFPRAKACGCCVNPTAIHALREIGLGSVLASAGAVPLREFRVRAGGRSLNIPLTMGVCLSRAALDTWIIQRAIRHGVSFLPQTAARVEASVDDAGKVELRRGAGSVTARGRVVIVADGLGGRSLDSHERFRARVSARSHIGLAAIIECEDGLCPRHAVTMTCHPAGYVGMVRLEDGRLNVAAALSPHFLQSRGGAGPAVCEVLAEAAADFRRNMLECRWLGTPPLTRRRSALAGERLFVVGDCAGYVEPFTGEGMAWAILGAKHLAPVAAQAAARWEPSLAADWTRIHRKMISRRQWTCRVVAATLRNPVLTRIAIAAGRLFPHSSRHVVERLLKPPENGDGYGRDDSVPGHGAAESWR